MKSNTEQPLAVVAILSDTHGVLPDVVRPWLQGVDHIFHAGDVGAPVLLSLLSTYAPVTAVRGNTDSGPWAQELPLSDTVETAGPLLVHILHDINLLAIDPVAAGCKVVVHGHLHRPSIKWHKNILYLNPGSVSHGRSCPESLALLKIFPTCLQPEIIPI